jgi:SAM-dependent methyltransferase
MGFFTLDMARLAGPSGRVVAIDIQQKMISALKWRARRAGLGERIETRLCPPDGLGAGDLAGRVDLACAFYVVHEVPDARSFLTEMYSLLVPGGRFFIAEPKGHVSEEEFEESIALARTAGFEVLERPEIGRSRNVLLGKGGA